MVQIHRRISPQVASSTRWSHQTSVGNSHHQKRDGRRLRKISLRGEQLGRWWKRWNRFDRHCTAFGQRWAAGSDHRLWTTSDLHLPLLGKSHQDHALDERRKVHRSHRCHLENRVGEEGRQGNVPMRHQEWPGKRSGNRWIKIGRTM